MGVDDLCNTSLVLGLGFSSSSEVVPTKIIDENQKPKNHLLNLDHHELAKGSLKFDPSLTLSLSGEAFDKKLENCVKVTNDNNKGTNCHDQSLVRQNSSLSSFSNVSVKREREIVSEEAETTTERVSSRISDEDEDGSNGRKKLRLTKPQSALLEESFKKHSTLNPKQKQELAKELNLRPRQVEVWFQNRRARTKLKQTEIDYEFLKKCCETLTDENRRLHKELQELKALKLGSQQPFYMQLPAATLSMCPSCERIGGGINGHDITTSSKSSLISIAPKPHFFNPFTKSAAC
ncbi:hypothetical protein LIER_33239 [Lithospermum erythrorhizon]|uniref:Homeobox domain-containing protein n=1 Tax=Lithospermum erythrorhizon TaxID=34254 RepID=A0AAV3S1R8_LITER